jgi:chemotaxis signal transduction protein
LRGDEQLALVAQTCRDKITIEDADIVRPDETVGDTAGPLLGRVRYGGEEILVLDVNRLFTSATRQRERRRRRF